jgi:hypothetical protein
MHSLIEMIKRAHKIEDVLNVANFKAEFNNIMKQIHPDTCNEAGASDATSKMNIWKDEYENGKAFTDDIGTFKTNGYWVDFKSSIPNLKQSFEHYNMLQRLT